jgi:hypothetical protein
MNPPRLIQQHIHFHFFIFIVMKLSWISCFYYCYRVTVDNTSSRTTTLIKVWNLNILRFYLWLISKGSFCWCELCRLIVQINVVVCWKLFKFLLIWISLLEELIFHLMVDGSWMVRWLLILILIK